MPRAMEKVVKNSEVSDITVSAEGAQETTECVCTNSLDARTVIVPIKEKRKFEQSDPISCISITSGELGMKGLKSNINYTWFGRGEVVEVEYQDLVAAIRSSKKHITEPLFIIQDEDFLVEFPQVAKIYDTMLSLQDLVSVFNLSASDMKRIIPTLPAGAQKSIKHLASTKIADGTLDSVQKIKALDELFDTKFMLMTELFSN